eukprot:TRINITY_DN1687_c0_g1_i1.p1 TRINITY_DN1687_c0_g1~~TRINITY_DN1687_c0_g1_i1.p1  ORF type:complete len:709 (-),score=152.90 TRINITY_DN1687_c0_g1_i1:512-2638(-)
MKTYKSLVEGFRKCSDETQFVAQAVTTIGKELTEKDDSVKVNAVKKLIFLQMLGTNIDWASFNIVEVMSMDKFALKRIGFLAASQTFTPDTDVVVLCTNLLSKEFRSQDQYSVGLAVSCLSNICTPDLARDLLDEVMPMLASSKPYIRKRAILSLYTIFRKYPQALPIAFEDLKKKLLDSDVSVACAAVNVICELAKKRPSNYLSLAPVLYKLLSSSHNNWMMIKIVKLFALLVPEEHRLAKKLLQPLAHIIQTNNAKSMQFECLNALIVCLEHLDEDTTESKGILSLVKMCFSKIHEFVQSNDQNLKYLGLVGLSNLMRSHPRLVMQQREAMVKCLKDEDVTIRLRALDLLCAMVTRRNLKSITQQLLDEAASATGTFLQELVKKILFNCTRDHYAYVNDFAWMMTILADLAGLPGLPQAQEIAKQIQQVPICVPQVRSFAVRAMLPIINDSLLASRACEANVCAVVSAAAWVVGEFADNLHSLEVNHEQVVAALMRAPSANDMPSLVRISLTAAFKVVCAAAVVAKESPEFEFSQVVSTFTACLEPFGQNTDVAVQERTAFFASILLENPEECGDRLRVFSSCMEVFGGPINPKAQKKLKPPSGLNLNRPIFPVPKSTSRQITDFVSEFNKSLNPSMFVAKPAAKDVSLNLDDMEKEELDANSYQSLSKLQRKNDPWILGSSLPSDSEESDLDIPLQTLTNDDLQV